MVYDYDKIYEQNNGKTFYDNYKGIKLISGKISLENAIKRMKENDEFYTLVTCREGDILPECYAKMTPNFETEGTLYATVNPDKINGHINYLCRDGGIQMISRLPNSMNGSPTYLLGPGPDKIELFDLVGQQLVDYNNQINEEKKDLKVK